MSYYGSGERQNDEMKAASCRDGMAALTKLAQLYQDGTAERLALEARIGREAIKLAELEKRLEDRGPLDQA